MIAAVLAAGAVAAVGTVAGQGTTREIPLAALLGASPDAVATRLTGRPVSLGPSLTFAGPEGPVSLFRLRTLVHGDATVGSCFAEPAREATTSAIALDALFVFRRGGLRRVVLPRRLAPVRSMDEVLKARGEAAALVGRGLPLKAGLDAALASEGAPALDITVVRLRCLSTADIAVNRARNRETERFDEAGFFQGVGVLPLAPFVAAAHRRDNTAARAAAGPVLESLRLGMPLPEPLERLDARPGVRVVRSADGRYAVVSVDTGGQPLDNFARMHRYALVGVRDGRVEWIAPDAQTAALRLPLCVGAAGKAGPVRPGCSSTGYYQP